MFIDEIRRAVEAAPRCGLTEVSSLLWKAFAAGRVSETEAEEISELIESKKAVTPKQAPRRSGPRPRSPASTERRRSWSSSGRLPPKLSARFTSAEVAVLAVVAVEVKKSGDCRWPRAKLAAVAGVSESTVKRALRAARDLGLVVVEERRLSAFRNETNIVRIVSPEWITWLRVGGGGQGWSGNDKNNYSRPVETSGNGSKGFRGVGVVSIGQPFRSKFRPMEARQRVRGPS